MRVDIVTKDNPLTSNDLTDYWVGPFDIKIPLHVKRVPEVERCNTRMLLHDGAVASTQQYAEPVGDHPKYYTEEEYLSKYCVLKNNEWWWKGN